jgi:hypothetical protein
LPRGAFGGRSCGATRAGCLHGHSGGRPNIFFAHRLSDYRVRRIANGPAAAPCSGATSDYSAHGAARSVVASRIRPGVISTRADDVEVCAGRVLRRASATPESTTAVALCCGTPCCGTLCCVCAVLAAVLWRGVGRRDDSFASIIGRSSSMMSSSAARPKSTRHPRGLTCQSSSSLYFLP